MEANESNGSNGSYRKLEKSYGSFWKLKEPNGS